MGGSGGGYFDSRQKTGGSQANSDGLDAAGTTKVPKARSGATSKSGIGGGDSTGDPCDIQTVGTLRSPPPHIVAQLSVGDQLSASPLSVSGVQVLQAVHPVHGNAGAIDCPEEQEILDCIAKGHNYRAIVRRIQGGVVTVNVNRV